MTGSWVEQRCLSCERKVRGYTKDKKQVYEGTALKGVVARGVRNVETGRVRYVHVNCLGIVSTKKFLELV